jgi:hypothetical protein
MTKKSYKEKSDAVIEIAKAFNCSKYFMGASGCRDVYFDELKDILSVIRFAEIEDIPERLKTIFKNSPQTIAMDKVMMESNCHNFNERVCDCFLPGVAFENCYCQFKKKQFLETTDYRNTAEYRQWRRSVFERDEYTCLKCGQVGGELNAHHIKKFKDYPSERYNIENGETLCTGCHRQEHGELNKCL